MQPSESVASKLLPILEPLQGKIKGMQCRVVPSAFNSADDSLRAFPISREWQWPSAEEHLKRFTPQTLILQLPSFWQLEPFAHKASRAAGAPVCNIEPQNYPLDKAAIRLASADAVLAEAGEAGALAEYLVKEHIALPPYWLLVYAGDAASWELPAQLKNKTLQVAQEVQLVPGVPLLVQCKDIVAAQNNLFHLTDQFAWGTNFAQPTISTLKPLLITILNFALPFALTEKGPCTCGKKLYVRS